MGWDFFYRFKGGGGVEKHCTSLHSDTVEDLIRISAGGHVWKMLMLERVCGQLVQPRPKINYRSWPSERHVTTIEDSP